MYPFFKLGKVKLLKKTDDGRDFLITLKILTVQKVTWVLKWLIPNKKHTSLLLQCEARLTNLRLNMLFHPISLTILNLSFALQTHYSYAINNI